MYVRAAAVQLQGSPAATAVFVSRSARHHTINLTSFIEYGHGSPAPQSPCGLCIIRCQICIQRIVHRSSYYAPPPSRLIISLHDERFSRSLYLAKYAQQSLARISGWPLRSFFLEMLFITRKYSRFLGLRNLSSHSLYYSRYLQQNRRFRLEEDLSPEHRGQLPILLDIYPPLPCKSADKIEIGMISFTIPKNPLPVCHMCSLIT